jgi:hypothetical protein
MNYEKLSVDRFALNLKEGKYAGLTGSRRAIGKCKDWSKKDRERAQELANKHFGSAGAAAKPAAKPAKKAGKKIAKKAKAAPVAAKPATKAPSKAKPAKRAVAKPAREPVVDHVTTTMPRLVHGYEPSTIRANAASAIIAGFLTRSSPLTDREQRAYDAANEEYVAHSAVSKTTLAPAHKARTRAPVVHAAAPSTENDESDEHASPAVSKTESLAGGPRPAPTPKNGHDEEAALAHLTPAEREQHEKLKKAAAATGFPVPTS